MSDNLNLFLRLTKLFRSGPVVKRKIRNVKVPGASSALETFRKAHSDVYNNALSAYGSYDRMSRYSDFSEMESCIAGDTLIATPEGFEEIQELAKKYSPNESFIVYSYDHEKQQIVPALGKQARHTTTKMSYKIIFDSGKELIATADHRVMRRDGTYCEVQDLKPGDSMMPFYRKNLFDKEDKEGYQWIYTMDRENSTVKNGWIPEHKVIASWAAGRKIEKNEHVHHKNFIRNDNRPENLEIMSDKDHLRYHAEILNGKKWDYKKNAEWIENFKKRHSTFMKDNNPAERKDVTFAKILQICDRDGFNWSHLQRVFDCSSTVITNRLRDNGFKNFTSFARAYDQNWKNNGWNNKGNKNPRYDNTLSFQMICDAFEEGMSRKALADKLKTTSIKVLNRVKAAGYVSFDDFKENFANHKVVKVVPHKVIDLYDLTVDGYKNYATDSIIIHNTPEISSALDIYAEETASSDESGNVLHIYSDNRKIKELLDNLFHDVLNIEFNLPMWVRNLVKYGDFFLFNDVHPEYGIINAYPISISEMEREEGFDPDDPMAVRFRWITQGNQILENWQVSHFRLLGSDAFLPYGSSVLEAARRIWRQLILIEDAMLVYRVIRAPERRVFYIDVGNVPPEDVANYLQQAQTSLKRNQIVDRTNGKVDLRYNPLPVWKNTPIPLLDGRTVTIEELSKDVTEGKESWVYSIQDDTQQIVPGKVVWCGKNYTADRMIKVWLDDETFVMTAPEHPFVMRDGSSKRADELSIGDSLMPFYRKMSSIEEGDWIKDYEKVYNPASETFEYTHKLVADDKYSALGGYSVKTRRVIHHVDYNKSNNEPGNLQEMSYTAHRKHHADHCQFTLNTPELLEARRIKRIAYNKSDAKRRKTSEDNRKYQKAQKMGAAYNSSELHKEHNEVRKEAQLKSWKENKEERSKAMKIVLPQECVDIAIDALRKDSSLNRDRLFKAIYNLDTFRNAWEIANSHNNRKYVKYETRTFVEQLKNYGFEGFADFKKQITAGYKNHKVLRIEEVFEPDDVYCMTVVGPQGEDDRHNFAIQSLNGDGSYCNNGIYVKNSVDEDYFLPVRGSETGTKIDTLAGGQNTAAIEDVEYIQKKLFAALKIPKAYLNYDEEIGSKATLAQEDIRFSKSIQRIQKTIISELNKIAMIHLYAHGYDEDSLSDFELRLSNPSSIAQLQKLELISTRFEIASKAPEGLVDRQWIQKRVLGLTDDEIKIIHAGRKSDRLGDLEVESTQIKGANDNIDLDDEGLDLSGPGDEGATPELGGEEEIDLFAGDKPTGKLLTSAVGDDEDEDDEDEEALIYSIEDLDTPVKVDKYIRNAFGEPIEKSRKVKGSNYHHMPNLGDMVLGGTSKGRAQDSLLKPYDNDFIKSAFGESLSNFTPPRLTYDMVGVFKRMDKSLLNKTHQKMLSESGDD